MVDVDAYLGKVLNDEGWQDRLGDSDAVTTVIQALEALLPAGTAIPQAEADRIDALLHGTLGAQAIVQALKPA
ncbi:MAG: hypothetical protein JWM80_2073 [Cyanobacteria bacterium RYN_339]|nr:hypothetical protein [Cyanobacteria bacterium RYN_339]